MKNIIGIGTLCAWLCFAAPAAAEEKMLEGKIVDVKEAAIPSIGKEKVIEHAFAYVTVRALDNTEHTLIFPTMEYGRIKQNVPLRIKYDSLAKGKISSDKFLDYCYDNDCLDIISFWYLNDLDGYDKELKAEGIVKGKIEYNYSKSLY